MDPVITNSAWDEALARLMAFLAAMHTGGVEHRTRLAMAIIDEARRQQEIDPTLPPVEQTMKIAFRRLDEWFGQALEGVDMPSSRKVPAGIVGMRVTDAVARFPDVVLRADPPAEMKATLARVSFRTGPDLAISSMTPREMEFGAMETIAQETWHRFEWAPILQAAVLWTAIFFAALTTYDYFQK